MAREIVLRRITLRAHSRRELEQALAKRNTDPEVAQQVLDRLTEVGLVNDRAFAEVWVSYRQEPKHLSRRALREELTRKGVDRSVIDEVLAEVDEDDEYRAAYDLAERKARPMSGLAPEVRWRRLAGALARRGFSAGVTTRVLRDLDRGFGEAQVPGDDW